MRSAVGLILGISLALLLSTVSLAAIWRNPSPRGSLLLSLTVASVCILFGGLVAGVVGEKRALLLGSLVGLAVGVFVSFWSGAFPLRRLFFESSALRTWGIAVTTIAGSLGGWLGGRLIAPGGLLTDETSPE